jgi:hypothetical protein
MKQALEIHDELANRVDSLKSYSPPAGLRLSKSPYLTENPALTRQAKSAAEEYAERTIVQEKERRRRFSRDMRHGQTFWVSEELSKLVVHASKDAPTNFSLEILPCPCALVLFEKPVVIHLPKHEDYEFEAMAWTTVDGKADVIFLSHDLSVERGGFLFHPHIQSALLRSPLFVAQGIIKFPMAFWLLIQQTLVEVRSERPERHVRHRLEKAASALAGSSVKYVMLRRVKHKAGNTGEMKIDWSHRWLVDGHWRKQWHPKPRVHRDKYILPYIKGPEDKEVRYKRALNLVVR